MSTDRIVCWTEYDIARSYTLECSLLGFKNRNEEYNLDFIEMGIRDYEDVGKEFMITLGVLSDEYVYNETFSLF